MESDKQVSALIDSPLHRRLMKQKVVTADETICFVSEFHQLFFADDEAVYKAKFAYSNIMKIIIN